MVNQFKNNFWPRPRDESAAFLATAVIEIPNAELISAMAVWRDHLYFAAFHAGSLPRLYRWDGSSNSPVEIAAPPWADAVPVPAYFGITVMAAYNDQLWVATSPNAGIAPPGPVPEIWFFDGNTWTNATTIGGFPGWTGASTAAGAGWMFAYAPVPGALGRLYIAHDENTGPQIEIVVWDGASATWAATEFVGQGAAIGNSTTPTTRMAAAVMLDPATNSQVVYAGGFAPPFAATPIAEVFRRTIVGWDAAPAYIFPTPAIGDPNPVTSVHLANSEVWAMQGGSMALPFNLGYDGLARVYPAPQIVRASGFLGGRGGIVSPSELETKEVIIYVSAFDIRVFDPDTQNYEPMSRIYDDGALDIVLFRDRYYMSAGSDTLATAAVAFGPINGVTSRILRID